MSVPMEEEDEDDEVWDMGRKPLKTVQDILDYWDHRLEKVSVDSILYLRDLGFKKKESGQCYETFLSVVYKIL